MFNAWFALSQQNKNAIPTSQISKFDTKNKYQEIRH